MINELFKEEINGSYIKRVGSTFVQKLRSATTFLDCLIGGDWFAITINKAQGQTFQYVGVDLRFDCFSTGQLYVGLSRTGNSETSLFYCHMVCKRKMLFILRFFENNTLKSKKYVYIFAFCFLKQKALYR